MINKRFLIRSDDKRRGSMLPARLRFPAHRGVTLVELMISMLILAIVCVAWLEIIGIQSAKKEARRREAVERLAGMMDAFMYCKKTINTPSSLMGRWYVDRNNFYIPKKLSVGDDQVKRVFEGEPDDSPIGYQMVVVESTDSLVNGVASAIPGSERMSGWGANLWLVGRLYDRYGDEDAAGRPFFSLRVCLWR